MNKPSQNQLPLKDALQKIDHLSHENYLLLEQLKAKDHFLKMFMKEMEVIFGAVSSDKTIDYIVGKGLEVFNINAIDILGRSIYDAIKSIPELIDFLEKALNGKPLSREIKLIGGVPYKFSSSPLFDESGKLLHALVIAYPVTP